MESSDVVVVGAGPGGCAAALACAASGATVRLLDAQAGPGRALSGEWLHPGGVAALERLGVPLSARDFIHNHGFMLHPGDGSPPIPLPYPQGTAVSSHHAAFTRLMRDTLTAQTGVRLSLPDRVLGTTPDGTVHAASGDCRGGLVVGADGRSSVVRHALRTRDRPSVALSHMAGLLLRDTPLPVEGYGHIFLGAPGPILAYRVAADTVRVFFDVPLRHPRPPGVYAYLRQEYARLLPSPLRAACSAALTRRHVQWAANRFRRRTFYGTGRRVLVGDAVGHGHPIVALGMASAILDGECLGRSATPVAYARERARRSWAAERLGAGAHRALTDDDPASLALRHAVFDLWRESPYQRDRMMALLGLQDERRRSLAHCIGHIISTAARDGPLMALGSWMCWLGGPNVGVPPGAQLPRHPLATAAV